MVFTNRFKVQPRLNKPWRSRSNVLVSVKSQPKIKRDVAKLVKKSKANDEKKYFDFTYAAAGIGATTQLVNANGNEIISSIPQDDTATGRDGRKATIMSVHIVGSLNWTASSNVQRGTECVFFLVEDKQANGALPPVGQIWNITSPGIVRNPANFERFRILKRMLVLSNDGGAKVSVTGTIIV